MCVIFTTIGMGTNTIPWMPKSTMKWSKKVDITPTHSPFMISRVKTHGGTTNARAPKKAGRSLISTCLKVQPDILLLGHAQMVERHTIEATKEKFQGSKLRSGFATGSVKKSLNHSSSYTIVLTCSITSLQRPV